MWSISLFGLCRENSSVSQEKIVLFQWNKILAFQCIKEWKIRAKRCKINMSKCLPFIHDICYDKNHVCHTAE